MKRWAGLMVLFFVFGTGCGKSSNPSQNTDSQPGKSQVVLAKVGTSVITKSSFMAEYKRAGHGHTPKAFLQKMIEEQMLALQAEDQKLGKAQVVKRTVRKAMVRQLLKKDFETWFTPNNIDLLQIRYHFRDYYHKYHRPVMARASHLLVRNPVQPRHISSLKGADKKAYPALIKWVNKTANEFKQILAKADPKTAKQFRKLGNAFAKRYNKPNDKLIAWYEDLVKNSPTWASQGKQSLIKNWDNKRLALKQFAFCGACYRLRQHLTKTLKAWRKQKEVSASVWKHNLKRMKDKAYEVERKVTVEKLPFFPEKETPGYPSMVAPFSKATFQLKDGEYSKTICKTIFGLHLIFRTQTQKEWGRGFQAVIPEIRMLLFKKQRLKKYKQWLDLKYTQYKPKGYLSRLKKKRRKK